MQVKEKKEEKQQTWNENENIKKSEDGHNTGKTYMFFLLSKAFCVLVDIIDNVSKI